MRITKAKAAENKAEVVKTAARLFREHGFDGIGVADVMRAAGMTHGGFYNHFESKEQLEEQACAAVFEGAVKAIEKVASAPADERRAALAAYVANYLSPRARDATGARCPMVAFGADVSRQGPGVQRAYAEGLARYLDALARALSAERTKRATALREEAVDLLVRLVGALTLARSVAATDPALSTDILTRTLKVVTARAD